MSVVTRLLTGRFVAVLIAATLTWLAAPHPARAQTTTDLTASCAFADPAMGTLSTHSATNIAALAILNCSEFNIHANPMSFMFTTDGGRILTRVAPGSMSTIDGDWFSNGIVFLVNPDGVLFGADAVADVRGLYAAAGEITDTAFENGQTDGYVFTNLNANVTVQDGAAIGVDGSANPLSMVHLLGRQVENNGAILVEPGGVVTMLAGNQITIRELANNRVSVNIAATGPAVTDPGVVNGATGNLRAAGGQVVLGAGDMYSLAVGHQGGVVAGDLEMRGPRIDLDSDVNANTATFDGAVVLGTDVLIEGETAGDAAQSVSFLSTVDAETAGDPSLTVDAEGTEFNGTVGATAALESVTTTGFTLVDTTLIRTTGEQSYGSDETLHEFIIFQDLTLEATQVDFTSAIDGINGENLTIDADAEFGARVGFVNDALGDLTVSGSAIVDTDRIRTAGLQAYGSDSVNDQFVMFDDLMIEATQVSFTAQVDGDSGQSLTIDANAEFCGDLGFLNDAVVDLVVNGSTIVDAAQIRTTGRQTYGDDATVDQFVLAQDATLDASQVEFLSQVDGLDNANASSLTIDAPVTFHGQAGFINDALMDLTISGSTMVMTDMIRTQGTQSYGDDAAVDQVLLSQHTTFTGMQVDFVSQVDGTDNANPVDLMVDGGASFQGQAGTINDALRDLSVTESTLVATDMIRTQGTQTYGNDATVDQVLVSEDTVLTGTAIDFASSVDGTDNANPVDLTLAGDATFRGQVGFINNALEDMAVTGNTSVMTDMVRTQGMQTYGDDAAVDQTVLAQNATFTGSLIDFTSQVDGVDMTTPVNLTVDGEAFFRAQVGTLNGALAELAVSGSTTIDTDMIATQGMQTYGDDAAVDRVLLARSTTLTGSLVDFMSRVDGTGGPANLIVDANAAFGGQVGTINGLVRDLTVTGTSLVGTDQITVAGTQRYNGDVTLATDATLTGLLTQFDEDVLGGGNDLTISGMATIGDAGDDALTNVAALTVDGAATVNAGSVSTTGQQTWAGAVGLGSDVAFTGPTVLFQQTIAGGGNDLTINADTTLLAGAVSNVGRLETDAAGTTTVAANVSTTNGIALNDAIVLGADSVMTDSGTAGILFGSTIDGPFALVVQTGGGAAFQGNVGETSALSGFETIVQGTVQFGGTLIRSTGNVILNDAVVISVPATATIGAAGDLSIEAGNAFVMGQNQKLTVLGNLRVGAASATLGDVNALGDMTVDAGAIAIRARTTGPVLGTSESDLGTDYIAGGRFFFSVTPSVLGSGTIQFANPIGDGDANGTLLSFIMRAYGTVDPDDMRPASGPFAGTFLDLVAQGPTTTNLGEAIPNPVPADAALSAVERDRPIPQPVLDVLRSSFALDPRVLDAFELTEMLSGRGVVLDAPLASTVDVDASIYSVVLMLCSEAIGIADGWRALVTDDRDVTSIRTEITDAWTRYQAATGAAGASARGFATHLARTPNGRRVRADLVQLSRIMGHLKVLGLTEPERAEPETLLLETFSSADMTNDTLRSVLDVVSKG